jgi:drug/metabolite transporter (DMT)-like permease
MSETWIRSLGFFALLMLAGIIGAFGDAALNHWAKSDRSQWLWISYAIWIGVATLFGLLLRCQRYSFSGAVAVALLVHMAAASIIDYIWTGRQFSAWEWLGLLGAGLTIAAFEVGNRSPEVAN